MIEISGLTKSYGSAVVLDGIDLTVGAAQIAAIVGPSGAGKSTLARTINLLEHPTSGSIVVNGRDLTALKGRQLRGARREIGTVFQSANLLSRLTAAENVALPLRHQGVPAAELRRRVYELLERVGLLHRAGHYPSQLSGGQRQRIAIARGLALRPSVLLSDEATSGLDPETTASILALLRELRDDLQVTILAITHEMDVVRGLADVVAHLDHGRIVEQGPVADVVRRSDSALAQALLPLPGAAAGEGLQIWRVRYDVGRVPTTWIAQLGRAVGSDVAVLSALVEDVRGRDAGRLTIGLDQSLAEDVVRRALSALGLAGTPASARSTSIELTEPAA